MKHTSTVLEPSIPLYTLVKLVDAKNIANGKIRTHDHTPDVNNITKQLQTQTLDSSQQEQLMFTQPRDQDNKNKPAYKNFAPTDIEQIIPSQQGYSNTNGTKILQVHPAVQFQTTTPTRQPFFQNLTYTPAQNTQTQNIHPGLTINTLHFNTLPEHTTSRNLSRPPLQTIPTNPLSYSLTITNPNSTQQSTTSENQLNTTNTPSTSQSSNMSRNVLQKTQFQTSNTPSTTFRTNPHIITTYTQPSTNPLNIPPNPLQKHLPIIQFRHPHYLTLQLQI